MKQLVHDLRSPLARAKTLALLLEGATEEERAEYLSLLLEALRELDSMITKLDP
jgi:signal transduction histidine kinase